MKIIDGFFSITQKEVGKEIALAIIGALVVWQVKKYLDKRAA